MGRLDGKVAVITGASSGIGRRTAEIFVAEGAKIIIGDVRGPEGAALAKQIGPNCIFQQTDVTREQDLKALMARAADEFGRLDCVFNNAGVPGQNTLLEDIDASKFDSTMAVLVRSVMLGMKYATLHMKKQGSGSIINTGSVAGIVGGLSMSLDYSTAKAAVIHLTKCAALQLAESGVRVNSISPGYVATAMGLPAETPEALASMRKVFEREQPMTRAGLPDDIANAAVFLASDESSFVSGHDLVVDGALIAGRSWTEQQRRRAAVREVFEQTAAALPR